jgi:hypothetical protein
MCPFGLFDRPPSAVSSNAKRSELVSSENSNPAGSKTGMARIGRRPQHMARMRVLSQARLSDQLEVSCAPQRGTCAAICCALSFGAKIRLASLVAETAQRREMNRQHNRLDQLRCGRHSKVPRHLEGGGASPELCASALILAPPI